jgi:hypothetical protein
VSTELIVKVDAGDLLTAIRDLISALSKVAPVAAQPATPPAAPAAPAQPATPSVPIGQIPAQQPAQQPPATVPTSAPTYTMEQLAVAATPLIDGGKRQELVDLLSAFGVRALTQLPKERYGEFATALRQLGAKI